jgi:parvulin-like peptidyl-prolyl isomerase
VRVRAIAVIILMSVLAFGCEKKPAAVVNGEEIPEERLQFYLEERMKDHMKQGASVGRAELRAAVLKQVISETLLLQGARKAGISVSEEELDQEIARIEKSMGNEKFLQDLQERGLTQKAFRDLIRERRLKDKFTKSLVPEDAVTEEVVREFYQQSPTPFLKPETVHVRFIQTNTREEAEEALRKVEESGDFDAVADALSEQKSAVVSGYGWTSPNMFGPRISEGLKGLQPGEYGGPYEGRKAHYLFRMKERERERPKTFEEAREEIRAMLMGEKVTAAVAHWVASRRRESTVVIN